MKVIRFRFTGTSPLLMHSERGANGLDPVVKLHKEKTSKRKKTDDDLEDIARSEWDLAIYWDETLGPFIPAQNIDGTIRDGAKKNKLGKVFSSSARCVEDKIKLIYDGPKSKDKLYEKGFLDVRSVVIGRARIMRVRPLFTKWALEFDYAYDETQLDDNLVTLAAEQAGQLVGLCDYRPRFGRFEVEVIK